MGGDREKEEDEVRKMENEKDPNEILTLQLKRGDVEKLLWIVGDCDAEEYGSAFVRRIEAYLAEMIEA
jgi:hypothetical protein